MKKQRVRFKNYLSWKRTKKFLKDLTIEKLCNHYGYPLVLLNSKII